ncbi:hypothetical protein PVAP13_1KG146800 [Panicum virgatum]|uniref:Uncharacterized protein n=1 Tax=Panicum virgatum TaxID=38727 RepID=A0A8T0XCB1_PANVG|nr:hypothetical protein PVAP13_1KG146800 [Panicum virgatum]
MNFKFVYGFTSKDYPQPSRIMSNTFRKLSVDTRFKEAGRRVLRDGRRQLPGSGAEIQAGRVPCVPGAGPQGHRQGGGRQGHRREFFYF